MDLDAPTAEAVLKTVLTNSTSWSSMDTAIAQQNVDELDRVSAMSNILIE